MENLAALIHQAEQALLKGAPDRAVRTLKKALALTTDKGEIRLLLAEALAANGRYSEAIDCLGDDPDNPDLLFAKADLLFESGQVDDAAEAYQRIIDLDPASSDAWVSLGLVHSFRLETKLAITCYRKALDVDPEAPFALNALGDSLLAQGDSEDAAQCYRRAIEVDPDDPQSHLNLGELLYDSADMEKAEKCCHDALKLDPLFAQAHLCLGNIFLDSERLPEAVREFTMFLKSETDPAAGDIRKEVEAILTDLKDELK